MPDEIGTGEIVRRLDKIERKLDDNYFISQGIYNAENKRIWDAIRANAGDINDIKETQKWLARTIGAAFLMLLVQIVVVVVTATT